MIVLVHSEMQPRGLWRLGEVQSLKHADEECNTEECNCESTPRSATVIVH